jgi:hypothetical protein
MTGQHEQIADALREMADKAASPRMRIDAAWRAGRRRRRGTMTASVASVAGAVAAAALVPFAVTGGSGHSAPGAAALGPAAHRTWPQKVSSDFPGPITFPHGKPIYVSPVAQVRFSQVSRIVDKPCPPGSHGVPSLSGHACYYLTSKGMTAAILMAGVARIPGAMLEGKPAYTVDITVAPADEARCAALTADLSQLAKPHNELAWIVHNKVLANPVIEGRMPASFQFTQPGGKAQQQQFVNELEAH